MDKKQILEIVGTFLKNENFIASHGTSVTAGKSIMETGLRCYRTTFINWNENSDPRAVASYAWKETSKGDSCNVVIVIPSEFMELYRMTDSKENEAFMKKIREENKLYWLAKMFGLPMDEKRGDDPFDLQFIIPKEFIRGVFIHNDISWYLSEGGCSSKTKDEKLDCIVENLEFQDNPNYYGNLSIEEKRNFIIKLLKNQERHKNIIDLTKQYLDKVLPLNDVENSNRKNTKELGKETIQELEDVEYIDETEAIMEDTINRIEEKKENSKNK